MTKKALPQVTHFARVSIDRLFDTSAAKCVKCGALMGKCDCWTKCACGWSVEKGAKCRNPIHKSRPSKDHPVKP